MKKLDIEQAEPIRKKFTPSWEIRKGTYLYKKVALDDYNQMLRFLMAIEKPQVKLDHFADFMNFYNQLTIAITTHDVKGLTQLDFELALYIDKVLEQMNARTLEESDIGAVQQKFMSRVKNAVQKVPGGDASQVPAKLKTQIAQLVQDARGSAAAALAGSDEVQGGPAITKRMAQAEKQLFDMINQADPQMKPHLVAAMNSAAATGAKATPASANLSKQAPAGM